MKRNSFLSILLGLLGMIFFAAYNDNSSKHSIGDQWVSIATVENPEGLPKFFFELDNHSKMWTAVSNYSNYRPESGQRIIADYTILPEKPKGDNYDNDVKLNNIYEVLTKDLIKIDQSNRDYVGNTPIIIENIWISNDFLNVEFTFKGYNKIHFINMGFNPSQSYNDDKIHLEFRHNDNDDIATHRSWGMASFNIKSLQIAKRDSVIIVVHSKSYDSIKERMDELIYKFDDPGINARSIVLNKDKGKIE